MGSVNNWLGFSLSPNMAVEMQEPNQSQSAASPSNNGMVLNTGAGATAHSIGFGNPRADWVPSSYILDSMNRSSHNDQVEWHHHQQQQSRSMDLSMLVGGGSSEASNIVSSSHGHGHGHGREHDGPKLEDFLGGASLGGQYSDGRANNTEGGPSSMFGGTPFNGGHHAFNAFDIPDSELSATNSTKQHDHQQQQQRSSENKHDAHVLQALSSNDQYIFPECTLGGSNNNGMNGFSMIKTWMRSADSTKTTEPNNTGLNYGGATASSSTITTNNTNPNNNTQEQTQTQTQQKDSMNTLSTIQSLSLSMSPNAQSNTSLVTVPVPTQSQSNGVAASADTSNMSGENKKRALVVPNDCKAVTSEPNVRKSIDTFGQRTSVYRGVTRHRWTGRYEAHLWDNSCRREGQTRKGRQVYLGGYDKEEKAARAYDLAALKYWGPTTTTNFPISNYEKELEEMKHMTRQEYVASLRRKSSGFSRGASIYRGVTRHHQHGRWQARIGRVAGNKDLYLGTFSTQEEAAEAYDIAAIKFRGLNAVTNFDMSRYDVKSILASSTLPVGGHVKRIRDADAVSDLSVDGRRTDEADSSLTTFANPYNSAAMAASKPTLHEWPAILAFQQQQQHRPISSWCKQETQDDYQSSLQSHKYYQSGGNMFQANNANGVVHNLMGVYHEPLSMDLSANAQLMGSSLNVQSAMAYENQSHNIKAGGSGGSSFGGLNDLNMSMNLYNNDPYTRGMYYLAQQQQQNSSGSSIKSNYDSSSASTQVYNNNWANANSANATASAANGGGGGGVTSSPHALAQGRPNLSVCHAPIFSIWNDS